MTVTSSLRDCKNLEIYAARQRVRQRVTAREISLRLSARMITVAFFAQFHVKLDVPGAAWIRSFGRSARRRRTENGRRELSASRTCKRTFAFPTFVLGLPMPAYAIRFSIFPNDRYTNRARTNTAPHTGMQRSRNATRHVARHGSSLEADKLP
jgi:hypothetical protein